MSFPAMIQIVPEGQRGIARVEHFVVNEMQSRLSIFNRSYVPAGNYARLYVGNTLMMSDTIMEKITNLEVCRRAQGNVLIAGLGLGLILTRILPKPEVKKVKITEKYLDVIELIAPRFESPKLEVIHADIFEWHPAKGEKFDTIYFDIWPDINVDNLADIATLHQRFKFYLNRKNPQAWMASWQQDHLRALRRNGE